MFVDSHAHLEGTKFDSDRAEVLTDAAFVCRKKFLYCVGGVGTIVQNLGERGVARADSGERIAQSFGLLGALVACVAKSG